MWILNVGDIKPAEYQIELFMDMAWNIEAVASEGVTSHLKHWLERELGASCAKAVLPVMQEHYRLAHIRKPEFMGNTREEEKDPVYRVVKDLPWSEKEINGRLQAYDKLSETVERAASKIPSGRQSAYFELVKYPVQAATQMNRKLLYAQLARHGKADWEKSDLAYDSIVVLTKQYNSLEDGKWNRMMDFQPLFILDGFGGDGEGRFITFYFIIFYTISFFIYKKNTKVINLPSPSLTLDPYLVIKRQRGILKTQSSFSDLPQRFQNTPLFYSKRYGNE